MHRNARVKDMTPAMAEVFLNRVWVSTVEFYPPEFLLEQCEFLLFVWTHAKIHFCCLDIQIGPGLHPNPNNFHRCLIACLDNTYLAIHEVVDKIVEEEVRIASSLPSLSPQALMDLFLLDLNDNRNTAIQLLQNEVRNFSLLGFCN